jgi:hypothetical protein
MKSFASVLFVNLATLGVMAGFAAVAQAGLIYANWRGVTNNGLLKAYDLATGAAAPDFSPTSPLGLQPQGVAISPIDGNVYVALYSTSPVTRKIVSYDPTTGAVVNSNFYSNADPIRGLCFDSNGDLYAALGNKYIAKILSDGTYDNTWGNLVTNAYAVGAYPLDIETSGGYLYATVQGAGTGNTTKGRVVKYDLSGSTSVEPTLVTTDADQVRVSGLALGPDGTMYTTISDTGGTNANTFGSWNSTFDTYTVLRTGLVRPLGIEYSNGSLYLSDGNTTGVAAKLDRYNLSSAEWTASWVTSGSTSYKESGFLAIAATAISPLPGDADRNGTVNGADLNVVLSNYNGTFSGDTWVLGDFDGNGTVNGVDLNVVLSNYNQSSGGASAAVPEPSTLLLIAAGIVGLLARGRRKRNQLMASIHEGHEDLLVFCADGTRLD